MTISCVRGYYNWQKETIEDDKSFICFAYYNDISTHTVNWMFEQQYFRGIMPSISFECIYTAISSKKQGEKIEFTLDVYKFSSPNFPSGYKTWNSTQKNWSRPYISFASLFDGNINKKRNIPDNDITFYWFAHKF